MKSDKPPSGRGTLMQGLNLNIYSKVVFEFKCTKQILEVSWMNDLYDEQIFFMTALKAPYALVHFH